MIRSQTNLQPGLPKREESEPLADSEVVFCAGCDFFFFFACASKSTGVFRCLLIKKQECQGEPDQCVKQTRYNMLINGPKSAGRRILLPLERARLDVSPCFQS